MSYRLVRELAADGIDVAVACRVLKVSRSGYYDWRHRPPSTRDVADAYLTDIILDVHTDSRCSYGAPRVHAELRLGLGVRCGRKRVARLMRQARICGIGHRRKRGRRRPAPATHDDLVRRRFRADAPDRLWCTDITEHPTGDGTVYLACVEDVFSRQIVGWSIADHMRSELVVDALQMATWRRRPTPGTVVHSDRGSQGEFNRSSQRLVNEEVFDGSSTTGFGSCRAASDEIAWSSVSAQACGAGVLAADRRGHEERGCRGRCRRVRAGRDAVVPQRWRHAADHSHRAVGPVPVVR